MSAAKVIPLAGQPHDGSEPVFREAWQAQAFAMALILCERGVLTQEEWTATLAEEIRAAQAEGDPDLGTTYYLHWLNALERLVAEKGIATTQALHDAAHAWHDAARATPHGQPIVLARVNRPQLRQ